MMNITNNHLKAITNQRNLNRPWHWNRIAPSIASKEDRFMALAKEPKSDSAMSLSKQIAGLVDGLQVSSRRSVKKIEATTAIIADLLAAYAFSPDLFSFRPMGKDAYAYKRISYTPAKAILDGLVALGLVDFEAGFKCRLDPTNSQTARYRANGNLIAIALSFGVTPSNLADHYRSAPPPAKVLNPVIRRGKREVWHKAERGKLLDPLLDSPTYIAAAREVDAINAYMAKQAFEGFDHQGFRRIFNHGDQQGFDHNMGGRLYSVGGGYQNLPKEKRKAIKINGEAVTELDVRASHLTILYGLKGKYLSVDQDPYDIAGFPRHVVKAWIGMTMGYDRFHRKWSKDTVERLAEKDITLANYNIEDVRDAVLARHPILTAWPESNIRWPTLQYVESCILINTVLTLAREHDIPALSIHDSIIIPVSRLPKAEQVFRTCFEQKVGLLPYLSCK